MLLCATEEESHISTLKYIRGSMRGNVREEMETVEGDETQRFFFFERVWEEAGEAERHWAEKRASAHKMRKWSGSHGAGPPNVSLCRRTPHYCTSWALGVAFEVLWGTSSHETSIVNPLVNQVCSWAYVWSGSFSSEDSKRSKEIVAGAKDEVSEISDQIRVRLCENRHTVPHVLDNVALQQALTSKCLS